MSSVWASFDAVVKGGNQEKGKRMQNNQKVDHFGFRDSAFLLNLLVTGDATTLTPFLRRGFGVEAFRHSGLVALVMILLYAGAYNSVEMYWFLGAWIMALIIQHDAARRRERKGVAVHSQYQGTSWFAGRFRITDNVAKTVLEPMLCLVAGALLCPVSEALGGFVMLGFLSLSVQRGFEAQIWTNRVRRMKDAAIEQRHLADLYRGEEF